MMFPFDLLGDDARPQAQTQLRSTTWVLSYIGQDQCSRESSKQRSAMPETTNRVNCGFSEVGIIRFS